MWTYETRTPVFSKRELELGALVSKGPMPERFAACREILSYDLDNSDMLRRCRRCGDPFPCQVKYCAKCYDNPLDPNGWRVDPDRFISDDVVNPVYYEHFVGKGAYRRIQRTLSMLEPFYGLPVQEIVPATLKFCYLQGGEDYVAVKRFYHGWVREIMNGYRMLVHPDAKLTLRFEWSWTTAGQAKWELPLRAPGVVDVADINPNQVVALFHAHTIGHFPGFDSKSGGQFFRMVFDGSNQVHVATPRPDRILDDFGGDFAAFNVEEPSFVSSPALVFHPGLPDHPDDQAVPLEHCSQHQFDQYDAQKLDQRIDALAEVLCDDFDEGGWVSSTDERVRFPGLVKLAQYACKEHLPKAKSRYSKFGSGTASQDGLTPEQMVIACHADAELKRAIGKNHLFHSFGTRRRTSSKAEAKPSPKQGPASVCRPAQLPQDNHPMVRFDAVFIEVGDTAVSLTWCRSHSNDRFGFGPTLHLDHDGRKTDSILKEDWPREAVIPLFRGAASDPDFALSLGVRVLLPP